MIGWSLGPSTRHTFAEQWVGKGSNFWVCFAKAVCWCVAWGDGVSACNGWSWEL